MTTTKESYVIDANGNRVAVLLEIAEYEKILAELEDLEAIRAYDSAKSASSEVIPFDQAVAEIEQARQ